MLQLDFFSDQPPPEKPADPSPPSTPGSTLPSKRDLSAITRLAAKLTEEAELYGDTQRDRVQAHIGDRAKSPSALIAQVERYAGGYLATSMALLRWADELRADVAAGRLVEPVTRKRAKRRVA